MKKILIIILFALHLISTGVIADSESKEVSIKKVELEYIKKFDDILFKTDLKYNKLRNILTFQEEGKSKQSKETLNKLNLYLKENTLTKYLYAEKEEKIAYINKHSNLDNFKSKSTLTSEEVAKIKKDIKLLEKEKKDISLEISNLYKSSEIVDYVELVLKSDEINYERLIYRNKLIRRDNSKSKLDCDKYDLILTKLNVLCPDFETPEENVKEASDLTTELIFLNKKLTNYKFISDEKYDNLNKINKEFLKKSMDMQEKIQSLPFGIEIAKKNRTLRNLDKKLVQLNAQIYPSKTQHKHTANCKHNH